jgi:indole-3-glycerol phosphate synthase
LEAKSAVKQNALIAEIKKASPSKGIIRQDFNPTLIASAYEKGGAACISVLTDIQYFGGSDENLRLARLGSSLPLLRKDFMLDSYQVFEARALGADCILLIMAALSDKQAAELEQVALSLGMDVLVEVHDEAELARAMQLQSRLIGINNRNLATLKVDIATTVRLAKLIPSGYIIVCESGISSHSDIVNINKSDVYCFLVGESLMLQEDIESATKELLGV